MSTQKHEIHWADLTPTARQRIAAAALRADPDWRPPATPLAIYTQVVVKAPQPEPQPQPEEEQEMTGLPASFCSALLVPNRRRCRTEVHICLPVGVTPNWRAWGRVVTSLDMKGRGGFRFRGSWLYHWNVTFKKERHLCFALPDDARFVLLTWPKKDGGKGFVVFVNSTDKGWVIGQTLDSKDKTWYDKVTEFYKRIRRD